MNVPRTTKVIDAVEQRLPRPLRRVVERFRTEDVFLLSAGLAFYALVSVAPFCTVVLWLVSLVTGKAEVQKVADELARQLPPKLGVDNALRRVADLGVGLGVSALIALLWPATAYGSGLRRAFTRLGGRKSEEGKGIRGRALALGLLGVVPALALAGLVAAYLGTAVVNKGGVATVVGWGLGLVFGFVVSSLAVGLIFRLFAPRRLSWVGVARGAATSAAAISALSVAYAIFLNSGLDFERRYATSGLAAVVLLAFWLFMANAFILVGFQVAQES